MVVEAGVTLTDAAAAAREKGRLLGISHGGRSSQIGGNLSTNAGGINVLRYGTARQQVLGLEVVLADGTFYSVGATEAVCLTALPVEFVCREG